MATEDPTAERWLPIQGYEGLYEVSDHGRVRSLNRTVERIGKRGGQLRLKGRILTLSLSGSGYPFACLYRDAKGTPTQVHTLVLSAFDRSPQNGEECDHKNFDKMNNRISNLRWITHLANVQHTRANGRMAFGERHHAAKFTEADIRSIRQRISTGERTALIAKDYGVGQQCIHKIEIRSRWAHVG